MWANILAAWESVKLIFRYERWVRRKPAPNPGGPGAGGDQAGSGSG